MPNLMEYLRLKNIFGPQAGTVSDQPMGEINWNIFGGGQPKDPYGNVKMGPDYTPGPATNIASPDDYDVGARMNELYTPEHAASDRFNKMIDAYPNRQDYHPSMMRRIGSALIATGQSFGKGGFQPNQNAVENGMEFMNRPYNEKFTDWKNQVGPAQQSATLERANNANERQGAYQTVNQELRDRQENNRQKTADEKIAIAQDRASVYRLKSLKKGYKFSFNGPTVMLTDPDTGEVKDTGIKTGSLSDADKLEMQNDNSLEQIGARTSGALQVEDRRQTGRETIQETRGWKIGTIPDPSDPSKQIGVQYNEITGEVKPVTMGGKGVAPSPASRSGANSRPENAREGRVRENNAARQLANTRADLAKFIRIDSGGNFTVTAPGKTFMGGATGPTDAQYKEIQQAIYGGGMAPVTSHSETPQPIRKTQKNTKTGATRQVESTDGGKTWHSVQ